MTVQEKRMIGRGGMTTELRVALQHVMNFPERAAVTGDEVLKKRKLRNLRQHGRNGPIPVFT